MEAVNVFEHQKKEKTNPGIKNSFPVTGMTCAACASSVESILLHTEGVNRASVTNMVSVIPNSMVGFSSG